MGHRQQWVLLHVREAQRDLHMEWGSHVDEDKRKLICRRRPSPRQRQKAASSTDNAIQLVGNLATEDNAGQQRPIQRNTSSTDDARRTESPRDYRSSDGAETV